MVTPPVAAETDIPVPAAALVTPVFENVTAPVAAETDTPVPATALVTPLLAILIVSVAASAVKTMPVPALIVTVSAARSACRIVGVGVVPTCTFAKVFCGADTVPVMVTLSAAASVVSVIPVPATRVSVSLVTSAETVV